MFMHSYAPVDTSSCAKYFDWFGSQSPFQQKIFSSLHLFKFAFCGPYQD